MELCTKMLTMRLGCGPCVLDTGSCVQLHPVYGFISRACLERVGTEYHVLFAVVAVRCVCAMYCLWNICGSTGFVCASFRSVSSS
jgi:hypothetical protein